MYASESPYIPTYLPTHLPTDLSTYLPTYPPTHRPTDLPTYRPTQNDVGFLNKFIMAGMKMEQPYRRKDPCTRELAQHGRPWVRVLALAQWISGVALPLRLARRLPVGALVGVLLMLSCMAVVKSEYVCCRYTSKH